MRQKVAFGLQERGPTRIANRFAVDTLWRGMAEFHR
jgi:hypothetical protein